LSEKNDEREKGTKNTVGVQIFMIINLANVKPGNKVKVTRIRGGLGMRQRLSCLGIHPGDLLTVQASGIMQGPILVSIHGNKVALGRGVASNVLVEVDS
jgi:ferrous iron transport protein A